MAAVPCIFTQVYVVAAPGVVGGPCIDVWRSDLIAIVSKAWFDSPALCITGGSSSVNNSVRRSGTMFNVTVYIFPRALVSTVTCWPENGERSLYTFVLQCGCLRGRTLHKRTMGLQI